MMMRGAAGSTVTASQNAHLLQRTNKTADSTPPSATNTNHQPHTANHTNHNRNHDNKPHQPVFGELSDKMINLAISVPMVNRQSIGTNVTNLR